MTREQDLVDVTRLLGRRPLGEFSVVVRDDHGQPSVIRNAPFMHDGTPMPTLYWLTSPELIKRIGHLEAAGGVKQAEREVDGDELHDAHTRYATERDADVAPDASPRPFGGVGGTRRGVKCLHAHYANFLVDGLDPVGKWVDDKISEG